MGALDLDAPMGEPSVHDERADLLAENDRLRERLATAERERDAARADLDAATYDLARLVRAVANGEDAHALAHEARANGRPGWIDDALAAHEPTGRRLTARRLTAERERDEARAALQLARDEAEALEDDNERGGRTLERIRDALGEHATGSIAADVRRLVEQLAATERERDVLARHVYAVDVVCERTEGEPSGADLVRLRLHDAAMATEMMQRQRDTLRARMAELEAERDEALTRVAEADALLATATAAMASAGPTTLAVQSAIDTLRRRLAEAERERDEAQVERDVLGLHVYDIDVVCERTEGEPSGADLVRMRLDALRAERDSLLRRWHGVREMVGEERERGGASMRLWNDAEAAIEGIRQALGEHATSDLAADVRQLAERHAWADERRLAAEKDAIALRARVAELEAEPRRALPDMDDAGRARVLARVVAALVRRLYLTLGESGGAHLWPDELDRPADLTVGWRQGPEHGPYLLVAVGPREQQSDDAAIAIRGTLADDGNALTDEQRAAVCDGDRDVAVWLSGYRHACWGLGEKLREHATEERARAKETRTILGQMSAHVGAAAAEGAAGLTDGYANTTGTCGSPPWPKLVEQAREAIAEMDAAGRPMGGDRG